MTPACKNSSALNYGILISLVCIFGLLYIPGLQGPMLLDDYPQLEGLMRNNQIGLTQLIEAYLISNSGPLGRPVSMFSFILNAHFGGDQLWQWKLTNLAFHLLTAVSLYWLTSLLLRFYSIKESSKFWIALFVTLIWTIHPLHVSTVLYTVQRMTILSALFALLSMCAYLRGRIEISINRIKAYVWIAVSILVFFPLSVLSKENGLLILLYIALIEMLFFPHSQWLRIWESIQINKKLLLYAFFLLLIIALWIFIQNFALGGYSGRSFTLGERLFTELRIITQYLWQIVVPSWNNLGFYHDDIALSHNLFDPPSTALCLILLAGMIYIGFIARKIHPLISFGILFYFCSHLLESSVIPLELMFEHRNYLGSIGILLAFTIAAHTYIQNQRIIRASALLAVFVLSLTLLQFSWTWGNKVRLNETLFSKNPDSPTLIAITADQYVSEGKVSEAFDLLDRTERAGYEIQSLVIKCDISQALQDADLQKLNHNLHTKILSYELTGLIELSNRRLDGLCHFSDALFMDTLTIAGTLSPGIAKQKILVYQAYFQHKSNQLPLAIKTLNEAFEAAPNSLMPLLLASKWLIEAGDLPMANVYYRRALLGVGNGIAVEKELMFEIQSALEHHVTDTMDHEHSH